MSKAKANETMGFDCPHCRKDMTAHIIDNSILAELAKEQGRKEILDIVDTACNNVKADVPNCVGYVVDLVNENINKELKRLKI